MKKNIIITKSELKKIIKEGVEILHRKTLIENRINQINEELAEMGFGKQDSESTVVITIQVNGGWQETITIQPEDEDYYEVYHQFDNGKETRVNGGFHNMEDAVDWVKDEYLPNYNAHEIIDIEGPESMNDDSWRDSEYKKNFDDMMGNPLDNIDFMKEGEIMGQEEYKILEAYLEAALWTEEEEIGPASISDISDESREKANQDVLEFMSKAGSLLDEIDPEQVGHDLWLSRNGHGAGFFDRGLGEVGETLQDIAREMGSKYLYRGDDGKIYID